MKLVRVRDDEAHSKRPTSVDSRMNFGKIAARGYG